MLLQGVDVVAGEQPGRVRLRGRVRYDGDGTEEFLWFDVPAPMESHLTTSGNPWLVALLPLAVTLQEPLRIAVPVDEALLEGCHSVLEVWSAWYPHLAPVAIEATTVRPTPGTGSGGTGLFFSGGVDSFDVLLSHNGSTPTAMPVRVTDLLLIHGADIPLSDSAAFNRLRPRLADVAREFGAGLVDIATNLRETRWERTDWAGLSHAALLVAAGLSVEGRFNRLLIASSAPYGRLRPHGSHPITDALFSTSQTRVRHDGAHRDRPDRIQAIAAHPVVLKYLRVCWLGRTDSNCGRCPKCLLTMVGLELAGTLGKCETLPRAIDPDALRQVYFESAGTYAAYWMARFFRERAWLAGRRDLVELLDHALKRSDRLRFTRDVLDGLGRRGLIPARVSRRLIASLFRSSVRY
jgi:hypothetical protein